MTTYALAWNVEEQRPEQPFSIAEARALHDTGGRYSVLIGDGETTEKIITLELAAGVITSQFLDRLQRIALIRVYGQREGDRVFRERTTFYNYTEDDLRGERPTYWEITDFKKDGSWHTIERFVDGTEESSGFLIDDTDQWESVPAFGDYARISRYV